MKIALIYGSVRESRQGIKAARFIKKQLEAHNHTVTLVDPIEYPLPFLDKMYKEYEEGQAPELLEELHIILNEADGFIMVSAEYNHSVPPALKNILDHFQKEFFFKPAGIATYSAGPFGGTVAQSHLRVILGELGMATPSTTFQVSKVQDAFDEEGNAIEKAYERRIQQFLKEFDWYLDIMKEGRKKGTPF